METPAWMRDADLIPSNESMFGVVTWLFKALRADPSATSDKVVKQLKETYLNDAWLADKVIESHNVDFKDQARFLTNGGRMDGTWVELLKATYREALADTQKHIPVVVKEVRQFKHRQIVLLSAQPPRTKDDVSKLLFLLQQPFAKLRLTYMKSPFVFTVGNAAAANHKHRKGLETMFVDPATTLVPTLTKDEVKPVAEEILRLIELYQSILKSYRNTGMQLVVVSLKSMGNQIKMSGREQENIAKMMRIQSDNPMILSALEHIIRAFTRLLTETVK